LPWQRDAAAMAQEVRLRMAGEISGACP
jgi:hypothetical protein